MQRRGPTTPTARRHAGGLGSSPVARRYWGNHCDFLLLRVLRCFSSPRWRPANAYGAAVLQTAGLSHSETSGSRAICAYPELIAAYRVLHRLSEPRHPPCALHYFLARHRDAVKASGEARTSGPRRPTRSAKSAPGPEGGLPLLRLSCLCQHVKDLTSRRPPRDTPEWWRITDSNR